LIIRSLAESKKTKESTKANYKDIVKYAYYTSLEAKNVKEVLIDEH
jgi:hypothetical protein